MIGIAARHLAALATAIGVLLLAAGPAVAGRIEPGATKTTGTLAFTGINVPLVAAIGIGLFATGVMVRRLTLLRRGARHHG